MKSNIFRLFDSRFLIRRLIRKFIQGFFAGKTFEVVLDVGAGKSPYQKVISCKSYLKLDNEKRVNDDTIIVADLNEAIPISNDYVDVVILTEVMEHIKEPEICLRELHRILKKDGYVVVTTPFVWPLHEVPNDYYRYTNYGFLHIASKCGFDDIVHYKSNGYFSTIIQLVATRLKMKIFYPLVLLLNLMAIIILPFEKKEDFYLSNYFILRK